MIIEHNGYTLQLFTAYYSNCRTYVGLITSEGEPYADISVNLVNTPCAKNQVYIDTNNLEPELYELLKDRGIISKEVVSTARSGYCEYPLHFLNI